MLVCKFNLSEAGCKLARDCPKLHPVNAEVARREVDAKRTYILCPAYARDAKCDKDGCNLLHVSGALGPALDLPKPQRGESQGGRAEQSDGRHANRHPPRKVAHDAAKPPYKKPGSGPPPKDTRRPREGPKAPRTAARATDQKEPVEDAFGLFIGLGQTRGKLRQLLEAYTYVKKYASLTHNREAIARATAMELSFATINQLVGSVNAMLDGEIKNFDEGAGSAAEASQITSPEPATEHQSAIEPASEPAADEDAPEQAAAIVKIRATPAAQKPIAKPLAKQVPKTTNTPSAETSPAPVQEFTADDMLRALAD